MHRASVHSNYSSLLNSCGWLGGEVITPIRMRVAAAIRVPLVKSYLEDRKEKVDPKIIFYRDYIKGR